MERTSQKSTSTQDNNDGTQIPTAPTTLVKGSRLKILKSLPWNQRWGYFKDQLMWRSLATISITMVVVFLAVHILTPAPAPKLYIAIINNVVNDSSTQALQRSAATALDIPEGRRGGILIDTHFDLSKDGLSKLQTMLSNHEIDIIIADRSAFEQLAGYGYFTPLSSGLTASQATKFSDAFVKFRGYDDTAHADAFYDGSGHGPKRAYGLTLSKFQTWKKLANPARSTVLGIAQDMPHHSDAQRFISFIAR